MIFKSENKINLNNLNPVSTGWIEFAECLQYGRRFMENRRHTLHFGGVDPTQERPCTQQTVSINVIQDEDLGVWTRKSGATSLFQLKFSFSISSISDLKVKVRPVSF